VLDATGVGNFARTSCARISYVSIDTSIQPQRDTWDKQLRTLVSNLLAFHPPKHKVQFDPALAVFSSGTGYAWCSGSGLQELLHRHWITFGPCLLKLVDPRSVTLGHCAGVSSSLAPCDHLHFFTVIRT
jgi:hypothetical protein